VRTPSARLRRGMAAVVITVAVWGGAVAPADARRDGTIETSVAVELYRDGHAKGRSTLKVARTSAADVSAVNRAYAYVQCDDCRAVALSFQVVFANRGPTNIAADNAAVALSEACERCETVAIAYQFVVASPHRSHLTRAGHWRLAKARFELHQLGRSGRPTAEITADAGALAAEVADVLTTELRTRPKVDRHVRTDR
jgi:hypothetical protein